MNYLIAASALACLAMSGAQAAPISHIPTTEVGQFLAEKFDLASIRSSINPRRTAAQRTFKDMGLRPSAITADGVRFDLPGYWFYELKILGRRDTNRDGIEDLEVCFTDQAQNGGNYRAQKALLITRYTADGYAVALSFGADHKDCASYP